ncbi:MAG TPA: MBL fold metallo-hydrolase [Candidatus Limnocylindrales bacterium]|nr:MBL fold metallo-hydrolase [Candidatus Limnocylindrales bacterium]
MDVEVRDVAPGLWLWRHPHWEWREGNDWEAEVASFVVESRGEVVLLDPLAPPPIAGAEVYRRLEAKKPTAVVVIKPDHVRDVDLFIHWYGIRGYGPWLWEGGLAPIEELQPILPDDVLPGGLVALFDGRGGIERPVYLPEQRAIVFADGMTAPKSAGGLLRVWWTPVLERRALPALRALLELPFELVLVSHGEPVHTRADFEAALEREPWSKEEGS